MHLPRNLAHTKATPPDPESPHPTEPKQNGSGVFRLEETTEGGPDTSVSRPPVERRSEPLSGGGTQGAGHGP